MPEAYSAPLVYEAIHEFMDGRGGTVLDPFCGTGTTLVAARFDGRDALGIEVNPFLCFASRVKTRADFDLPLLRLETGTLLQCGMRNAECGMDSARNSAFRIPHSAFPLP